jgi:peptidoglycan/LPS O-acetylase OafA/YrhL
MGHYAVTIFIVLSGYCLMLPVARAGGNYPLKGGFGGYIHRRARRILPAFYVAVLMTVALLPLTRLGWVAALNAGLPGVHAALGNPTPAELLHQCLAHLFLINNRIPFWTGNFGPFTNNTPLWSVATEWQIYFLFPGLLLPILRRFGPWVSVCAGIAASVGFFHLTGDRYASACPWMLGVFGIGTLGALITHSPDEIFQSLRRREHWGKASCFLLAMFVIVGVANLGMYRRYPDLVDLMLGLSVMCGLVALARSSTSRGQRWCADLFSSPAASALGGLSYSLYLIHYPLLILSQGWLSRYCPSLYAVDFMMLGPVMAGIVLFAWLFSRAFERPFMGESARRATHRTLEPAAVEDQAVPVCSKPAL